MLPFLRDHRLWSLSLFTNTKAFIINKCTIIIIPTMYSFLYHLQTFASTQPVVSDLLDLTDMFGVMALELFIQGHVRDELSQGHWSGRAKKWQRRTPCKQEESWGTDALARTSGFQPVALAQALRCLFHSTDHWTLDPPKLLHWMQLSYISHRSYSKEQEKNLVHIHYRIAYKSLVQIACSRRKI